LPFLPPDDGRVLAGWCPPTCAAACLVVRLAALGLCGQQPPRAPHADVLVVHLQDVAALAADKAVKEREPCSGTPGSRAAVPVWFSENPAWFTRWTVHL